MTGGRNRNGTRSCNRAQPTSSTGSWAVGHNGWMTEQLWAIGGAVAGIAATGGTNPVVERTKLTLSSKASDRSANRKRCEGLLSSVENELKAVHDFEEQHGAFPVDHGHESSDANARALLTEVELHCPRRICSTAEQMIGALESYIWQGGGLEDYRQARRRFIHAFRRL